MADPKFVTAINCMDGRTQRPVHRWMESEFNADYVDMITEPGPARILHANNCHRSESIRERVQISVEKHGSRIVAVVAHGDCAGNPHCREIQMEMLQAAVDRIAAWGFPVQIIGLWVDHERWEVEKVLERCN